jgi:hypothetical protein
MIQSQSVYRTNFSNGTPKQMQLFCGNKMFQLFGWLKWCFTVFLTMEIQGLKHQNSHKLKTKPQLLMQVMFDSGRIEFTRNILQRRNLTALSLSARQLAHARCHVSII